MTYLSDNRFDEFCKTFIDKIGDDTDRFRLAGIQGTLDVASHVLLKHGLDTPVVLAVLGENSLRAEQAALFSRVPVEFNCVGSIALSDILGL